MKRSILFCALLAALFVPFRPAHGAQTCEDRVRELGVYADALGRARARAELDGSRAIADLIRQRDELAKDVEVLKMQIKAMQPKTAK